MGGTKALLSLVVGLGVLIMAGLIIVATTLAHRLSAPEPALGALTLGEPPGTRVGALVAAGDRLALLLQGGGADRVILLDPRDGARVGTIAITGPAVPTR